VFAAPLLGAALYPLVGFSWLVALDALTFVLSFGLLLGVRDPMAAARSLAPRSSPIDEARSVLREVRDGIRVGSRDPYTGPELVSSMICGIGNGMFMVAIVPWLVVELGLPTSAYGVIISVVGVSGIAASVVVSKVAGRVRPERLVQIGVACGILGSAAFFGAPPLWLLAPCLLAFGVANVVAGVGSSTITQERFPSSLQGRLSSLMVLSFQGCQLLGVLIAGGLAGAAGVQAPMTGFAVLLIAANVLFLFALRGARRPVNAKVRELLDAELAVAATQPAPPVTTAPPAGAATESDLTIGA